MSYVITDLTAEQFANAKIVRANTTATDLITPRYAKNVQVAANIIPSIDLTYNVGIPQQRWKTLNTNNLAAYANTNQFVLGTSKTSTINVTSPSANRTYTLPDPGASGFFVTDTGGALNLTNVPQTNQYLVATGANTASWQNPVTMTLKNNGVNILNTPHSALNFRSVQGVTISATDGSPSFPGSGNIVVTLPTTTKGDLIAYTGTTNTRLAVGANGYVLTANSSATTGLNWALSTLIVQNKGTTVTGSPFSTLNLLDSGFFTISAANGTSPSTANVSVTQNYNVITPPSISADQNNYNPTGLATAFQVRLSPTAATPPWQITGLQAPTSGIREVILTNITTNTIILANENVGSTASNRFVFDGQNAVLIGGQAMKVTYDATSSRWRGTGSSVIGDMGGSFITSGVISPTALSTSQNDYNPTGLVDASVVRLISTALISITGLATGTSGKQIKLVNIGSNPISLVSNSPSSLAANRFLIGSTNVTLVGGATVSILYDGISNGWRLTGGTGGATGGAGGLVQSQWTEVTTTQTMITATWPTPNTSVTGTNGLVFPLPQATINVGSTTGSTISGAFPATGKFILQSANTGPQTITYTAKTATSFTGCTGGTGWLVNPFSFGTITWPGSWIFAYPGETTIAAGSNNVSLPTATINVASTSSFPASGTILVTTTSGTQRVTYTGRGGGGTTFTGCSGGMGIMSTGGAVVDVSPTAQDLMTINLTTSGGALLVNMSSSATAKNNTIAYFQVVVDGLVRRGGSTSGNGNSPAGSVVVGLKLATVAAGDHVIVVRWRVQPGSSPWAIITPIDAADDNNASLLVQEVTY